MLLTARLLYLFFFFILIRPPWLPTTTFSSPWNKPLPVDFLTCCFQTMLLSQLPLGLREMGQNCDGKPLWPLSGNSLCHQSCQKWGHEERGLVWVLSFIFPSACTRSWTWRSQWGWGQGGMCFLLQTHHLGSGRGAFGNHCPSHPLEKSYCCLFYSAESVLNKIQFYFLAECETQRDEICGKKKLFGYGKVLCKICFVMAY